MARKDKEVIETKTEDLLVDLTEEEISAKARKMAERQGELERHNEESRRLQGDRNQRKQTLEGEIRKLGESVREKSETRPVVVEVVADFKRSIVLEVRQDTGKTISERAMRSDERQTSVPGSVSKDLDQRESLKSIAKRLYSEGGRPEDTGIEKVVDEAAKLCGVETGALLDALVEVAEAEGAKKEEKKKGKGPKLAPVPEPEPENVEEENPFTEPAGR